MLSSPCCSWCKVKLFAASFFQLSSRPTCKWTGKQGEGAWKADKTAGYSSAIHPASPVSESRALQAIQAKHSFYRVALTAGDPVIIRVSDSGNSKAWNRHLYSIYTRRSSPWRLQVSASCCSSRSWLQEGPSFSIKQAREEASYVSRGSGGHARSICKHQYTNMLPNPRHHLQGHLLERPGLRDAVQRRRGHEEARRWMAQRDAGVLDVLHACAYGVTYPPYCSQILKVAGFDKPQRTRVLEREVQKGTHEKVQGGYGKYQGRRVLSMS